MPRSSSNRGGREKFKSITMVVGPFRMAFPAIMEPEEDDFGNEKYKVTMLFPPDSKDPKKIDDAMYEVMEDRFGPESDWPSGKKDILPEDKLYDAGTKTYQGFKKGWMAMTVSSNDQPGVIDADKNEVMSKREVYGGRWARAEITIASFDNKAKGVTGYLNHVQLLEHDDAFSGKGNAEDKFDKYELQDKGRGRGRDDDEDEGRNSRRRGRDEDDDRDDHRSSRSRSRDDEDRDDDRSSRRRSRDDDDRHDDRRERGRGRGRDDDDDDRRASRRGGRDKGRGDDEEGDRDRGRGRGRGRDDEDEERPSRRDRGSRSRDEDDDRPSRSNSRRGRDADDEWN